MNRVILLYKTSAVIWRGSFECYQEVIVVSGIRLKSSARTCHYLICRETFLKTKITVYYILFQKFSGQFSFIKRNYNPSFETTTTSTAVKSTIKTSLNRNAVLVLSTWTSSNKPFIVDYNGKYFMIHLRY